MDIAGRSLVYFSSVSENTHRFVQKLGIPATRIPLHGRIEVDEPYVLILPTYGGGRANPGLDAGGYVPKQVIAFLNNDQSSAAARGHRCRQYQLRCRVLLRRRRRLPKM